MSSAISNHGTWVHMTPVVVQRGLNRMSMNGGVAGFREEWYGPRERKRALRCCGIIHLIPNVSSVPDWSKYLEELGIKFVNSRSLLLVRDC